MRAAVIVEAPLPRLTHNEVGTNPAVVIASATRIRHRIIATALKRPLAALWFYPNRDEIGEGAVSHICADTSV
jgi:hypothetical protein